MEIWIVLFSSDLIIVYFLRLILSWEYFPGLSISRFVIFEKLHSMFEPTCLFLTMRPLLLVIICILCDFLV